MSSIDLIVTRARSERDVVISGMGAVTPLGIDTERCWAQLSAGRSGVDSIQRFDASGLAVQVAAEIRDFESYYSDFLQRETRTRKERIAFKALDEALRSAGLTHADLSTYRIGVFTGCEKEATDSLELFAEYDAAPSARQFEHIAHRHHRDLMTRSPDSVVRQIAARLERVVVAANYTMACAAGAVAVVQAVRWLRRGRIDCAIVVGADTPINSGTVHGFQLLQALSTRNAEPAAASRPFDAERDGFVLAEGAAALVLFPAQAHARNRRDYGRILGVGMSNNQYHLTSTPRNGEQAAAAIRTALDDAQLAPEQIQYINAHGTSTDVGDIGETNAIRQVFSTPPPVSSTKSMTGHLVAAAGTAELVFTTLAVTRGFLPPTINQTSPDPDCSLDYIPNHGRPAPSCNFALTNSFGFGGTNVSIIVGKP